MKKIALATLLLLPFNSATAGSVGGVGGALEVTQLLSLMQQVQQTTKMIKEIQNSANLLREVRNQAETLKRYNWGDAKGELIKLNRMVRQGQALAYSARDLEHKFNSKFKGYREYVNKSKGDSDYYKKLYMNWSQTGLDTIRSTLLSANIQAEMLDDESALIKKLTQASQSHTSQVQAIQVGHQIAAQQIAQLQKLRQLLMAQNQTQTTFQAIQNDKAAYQQSRRDALYDFSSYRSLVVGDEKEY